MTGIVSGGGGGGTVNIPTDYERARSFLAGCGLKPSQDAVEQLVEAFLPAVAVMCDRAPLRGSIWRQSGWRGSLFEARKKMHRLWYSWWEGDGADYDSAIDLLNFTGFAMRARQQGISAWGIYGDPSSIQKGE